jgi:hypothetical protein
MCSRWSWATTLNCYGHLWPDRDESMREAVDAVLRDRVDSLRTTAPRAASRRWSPR